MFLARYNLLGKTKREQLQLWSNLSFDPQKTDIDEQIDLVLTLGNMLQQDEHPKMDKFIETMPTIIQTHLIIEPNWAEVTKKAKNLEHIIRCCDPPGIAPPIVQGAGAVSSLYSHIANLNIKIQQVYPNHSKALEAEEEKYLVKVNPNLNNSLNHLPLPLSKKSSMKR